MIIYVLYLSMFLWKKRGDNKIFELVGYLVYWGYYDGCWENGVCVGLCKFFFVKCLYFGCY